MLQKIINFIEEKNMKWQHCMHELEMCSSWQRRELSDERGTKQAAKSAAITLYPNW